MPPHPLTNFEIRRYYQNVPRLNGVYSRDKLQSIKDGEYIINLDEYSDIGTHWVAVTTKWWWYLSSFFRSRIYSERD